jgi:nitrogen regulatory protein PII
MPRACRRRDQSAGESTEYSGRSPSKLAHFSIRITDRSNILPKSESKPDIFSPKKAWPCGNSRAARFLLFRSFILSWESRMKRIEVVITPWTLDAFKEAAPQLGISEFDLIEIYRSGYATIKERQRIYRGCEFTIDLVARFRIEFVLFDDDLQAKLDHLIELVHPESIAIFRLDQTISPAKGQLKSTPPSLRTEAADQVDMPARQLFRFLPRKGSKDSDVSSRRFAPGRRDDNDGHGQYRE